MIPEPKARRQDRGFTLIEAMVVVAIIGVAATLGMVGLNKAVRQARHTGDRFSLIKMINFARSRAVAVGRDVYVVFQNVEAVNVTDLNKVARVTVFEDRDHELRGKAITDSDFWTYFSSKAGDQLYVRESLVGGPATGLSFSLSAGGSTSTTNAPIADSPSSAGYCSLEGTPSYIAVTRSGAGPCSTAQNGIHCSFCKKVSISGGTTTSSGTSAPTGGEHCVGAIRFSADGNARLLTDATGSGGLLRLVDPMNPSTKTCLAIVEPMGLVVSAEK